ncbi:MAG: T9SS type A sorting domain-containing protein, partial [Bacteroidia bacterium]
TLDVNVYETFYNLILNKTDANTLTITTGDILYANGNLTYTNGSANGGSIQTNGNVIVGAGWDGGTSELWFNGSAAQTFDLTGAVSNFKGDIVINKNAGFTVSVISDLTMSGTGQDMYVNSGILNLNSRTVTLYNPSLNTGTLFVQGNFTISGIGTFNLYNYSQSASSYFNISGNSIFRVYNNFAKFSNSYADFHGGTATLYFDGPFSSTAGAFTSTSGNAYFASSYTRTGGSFAHNSGTVIFTGNDATLDVNVYETFNNLTINKNHNMTLTITIGDVLYALGILTYNNGKAAGGLIGSYSTVNVESDWDGGNTQLSFIGSAAQSFDLTGATDKFDGSLYFQKNDGYNVTLLSNITLDGTAQQMDLASGNLNLNGFTVTLYNVTNSTGNLNVLGNFNILGNGNLNVYNHNHTTSSTISFTGSPTYRVYNNFTQSSNSYAAFSPGSATVIIDGNFSKTAGTFVAPTTHLKVGGNWTVTGSFTNNGTITFIGNNATFNAMHTFTSVIMNKNTGQSLTMASGSSMIINSTLTLTNGLINTAANGTITMQCNSNVSAGSDCESPNSYINGPLTQNLCTTTPTTLFYPTGKGGKYRALWLVPTQTTNASTGYTVEQFEGTPPNYCIPNGLSCMSKLRWWNVTRSNTVPMVDPITLTFCPGDGVTHANNLRIAKQVGNCWSDMGGVGTGAPKGTITSNVNFTEYGDFTLANDGNCLNELPVKLISFSGNYSEGIETLTWKTASEINNDHFDVERSSDGKIWNKIGEVKGNGNSNSILKYTFEDNEINPALKHVYYRLKQVDYNGAFEYSPIIVENFMDKSIETKKFAVYPNPANSQIVIENLDFKKLASKYVISDINGSLLMEDSFSETKLIDINELSSGFYFISIYNLNGEVLERTKVSVKK